jgi:phage tail-like protein
MNPPESRRDSSIDAVVGDLIKVIRHHDPEWTDLNESDPGITLLQVQAWLTEQVYSSRAARPARTDPYRNFNFRVTFEGGTVATVRRVSALRRSVEVIEHREGGDPSSPRRLPGRVVYEPFTLERGLDGDRSFETWATQVGGTAAGAPVAYRRNIRIEVVDQSGRVLVAYDVQGCWPSVYRVLPDLTESLTVVADGWVRDSRV